jgi:hypothetical protein
MTDMKFLPLLLFTFFTGFVHAAPPRIATPDLSWDHFTDGERDEIREAERLQSEFMQHTQGLERDLDSLLGPLKAEGHPAAPQFLLSQSVRDQMIARILGLLKTSSGSHERLTSAIKTLATHQPIFDPRIAGHSDGRAVDGTSALDGYTEQDRLHRLADLVVFGIERATQKKAKGDLVGARADSAAALRAMIEAYLTMGLTTGSQRALFRKAAYTEYFLMIASSITAMTLTLLHQHNWSHTTFAFLFAVPLTLIADLAIDSVTMDLPSADWPENKGLNYFAIKAYSATAVAQPMIMPEFLRTQILRNHAERSLFLFWEEIRGSMQDRGLQVPNRILDLVDLEDPANVPVEISIQRSEKRLLSHLTELAGDSLSNLALQACDHILEPTVEK